MLDWYYSFTRLQINIKYFKIYIKINSFYIFSSILKAVMHPSCYNLAPHRLEITILKYYRPTKFIKSIDYLHILEILRNFRQNVTFTWFTRWFIIQRKSIRCFHIHTFAYFFQIRCQTIQNNSKRQKNKNRKSEYLT